MKISVDTKEDSHEDLRKVIRMLQHIVGDTQEVFINQPSASETASNPFANIFGDSSSVTSSSSPAENTSEMTSVEVPANQLPETTSSAPSESTEDLFAELFSEEELKKMDSVKAEEEEALETKPISKKYNIEFY